MLNLKLFTMQVIPLAFSFGVAYWLLITANVQEGNLKSLGKTLGWSVITIAMFSSLFAYYLLNNDYGQYDLPAYRVSPPVGCQSGQMMGGARMGEDMSEPDKIDNEGKDDEDATQVKQKKHGHNQHAHK